MKKKKFIITILTIILTLAIGISLYAGNFLVNYALILDENKRLGSMGSEEYTGIQDTLAQKEYDEWVKTVDLKQWTITNKENLKLQATVYPTQEESHSYVLAVHGYTVDHRDIAPAIVPFVKAGYHVIAPDQRGRGESEGSFVSMGWFEKNDVLEWIDYIIKLDSKAEIILYGESMGASTVMMAAGEKLPSNVKLLIEDCGYTSAYEMFKDQLIERFGLPEYPFLPVANFVSSMKIGFKFSDASAIKQIQNATLPILFIHGGADDYVPTYMVHDLYESYKGEKDILVVEGAGHGQSADVDPKSYYQTIFDFISRYK